MNDDFASKLKMHLNQNVEECDGFGNHTEQRQATNTKVVAM